MRRGGEKVADEDRDCGKSGFVRRLGWRVSGYGNRELGGGRGDRGDRGLGDGFWGVVDL